MSNLGKKSGCMDQVHVHLRMCGVVCKGMHYPRSTTHSQCSLPLWYYCVTESSPILNNHEKINVKKIPKQFHFFCNWNYAHCVVHILRKYIFKCLLFTDNRVRGRVCTYLKGRFRSSEAAEETYNLTLSDALTELTVGHPKQRRNNNAVQLQLVSDKPTAESTSRCLPVFLAVHKIVPILQDLPSKTGENCTCLFPWACIESWYRHKPRKLCFTISESNEVTAVTRKD